SSNTCFCCIAFRYHQAFHAKLAEFPSPPQRLTRGAMRFSPPLARRRKFVRGCLNCSLGVVGYLFAIFGFLFNSRRVIKLQHWAVNVMGSIHAAVNFGRRM
ncbi:TPA: hypothetical protein ACQVIF_005235, partial [Serratia marcescens]